MRQPIEESSHIHFTDATCFGKVAALWEMGSKVKWRNQSKKCNTWFNFSKSPFA